MGSIFGPWSRSWKNRAGAVSLPDSVRMTVRTPPWVMGVAPANAQAFGTKEVADQRKSPGSGSGHVTRQAVPSGRSTTPPVALS